MYSNSSFRAIPLWDWHCLQIKANRLFGPSPTRYSTIRSIYPRSRGMTGLGNGGPGAAKILKHYLICLWESEQKKQFDIIKVSCDLTFRLLLENELTSLQGRTRNRCILRQPGNIQIVLNRTATSRGRFLSIRAWSRKWRITAISSHLSFTKLHSRLINNFWTVNSSLVHSWWIHAWLRTFDKLKQRRENRHEWEKTGLTFNARFSWSDANSSRISLATLYVSFSMTSSRILAFCFFSLSSSISFRLILRWYHHVKILFKKMNLKDKECKTGEQSSSSTGNSTSTEVIAAEISSYIKGATMKGVISWSCEPKSLHAGLLKYLK